MTTVQSEAAAAGTTVRLLTPDIEPAYDDFLARHPGAMLYYSRPYRRLVEELSGAHAAYRVAVRGDVVTGVWPTMARKSDLGIVLNSLPFYGSHGTPLFEGKEAEDDLTECIRRDASGSDVAASVIIENPLSPVDTIAGHAVLDERISQMTAIPAPHELLNAIDPSARRNVRKAVTSGVTVDVDHTAIDFLFETHVQNMGEIGGRAKTRRFFDLVARLFEPGADWDLFVARIGGSPVAALLVLYFKDTVEYFTPVTAPDARPYQPTALILHDAMVAAHERGLRRWNWGGTWLTQDGVYKFKRKWGAQDRRYRYFVAINNRDILHNSPAMLREIYPEMYIAPYSMLAQ